MGHSYTNSEFYFQTFIEQIVKCHFVCFGDEKECIYCWEHPATFTVTTMDSQKNDSTYHVCTAIDQLFILSNLLFLVVKLKLKAFYSITF